MRYALEDKVVHCRNGVSVIVGNTVLNEREYYIIRSIRGESENIYVPIIGSDNIIRPIMDVSNADELLNSLKSVELDFNPNTKQRRDNFKKRLSSGKVNDVAFLFIQNYLYELNPDKVKLGPADLDMLNFAKNNLLDELSLTYQVDRDNIEVFVINKIKN